MSKLVNLTLIGILVITQQLALCMMQDESNVVELEGAIYPHEPGSIANLKKRNVNCTTKGPRSI